MSLDIDEDDPCTAARTLRSVYYKLVAGQTALTITFRAGSSGVERSVTFNKADPQRLLTIIREFETKCAALTGQRPPRYAVRGGGR